MAVCWATLLDSHSDTFMHQLLGEPYMITYYCSCSCSSQIWARDVVQVFGGVGRCKRMGELGSSPRPSPAPQE